MKLRVTDGPIGCKARPPWLIVGVISLHARGILGCTPQNAKR